MGSSSLEPVSYPNKSRQPEKHALVALRLPSGGVRAVTRPLHKVFKGGPPLPGRQDLMIQNTFHFILQFTFQ